MRYELFFWVTSLLFNVLSVALAENKVRRALLVDSQPTCSTPCNFDTRCSISNDGCPICRKNRCVSIPSCNSNCTLSEDCRGAFDNCSVCSPVNKQCVQPFPRCNMACSRDLDCSDGERTDNCGTCNLVRRVCVSSLPYRGSYCFSDDHCAGARDGAAVCNLVQGSCVISLPHRGSSCSANFDCQGSTDGSSLCVSGVCVSPGTLAPNPKCKAQCISDCNCWEATDGCIFCVGGYCTYNRYDNSNTRRCGLGCLSSSECLGSISDGCQRCQNNICVYGPSDTPTNKTVTSAPCISTEQELRNKLSQTNTIITLCENSDITLSQELIVTTAVTLQCAKPKKCTIQGGGRNRLITFTTGNVKAEGVTFQNGDSEGNGGAILFKGSKNTLIDCTFTDNKSDRNGGAISFESYGNSVSNCSFEGNSASFKGGAIYLAQSCSSTTISGTKGSSNDANQCKDIYCEENGSCINFP